MVLLEKVSHSFIHQTFLEYQVSGFLHDAMWDTKKNSLPLKNLSSCRKHKIFSQMRITLGKKYGSCHSPLGSAPGGVEKEADSFPVPAQRCAQLPSESCAVDQRWPLIGSQCCRLADILAQEMG